MNPRFFRAGRTGERNAPVDHAVPHTPVTYDAVPFFVTHQFGVWMEHTGYPHDDVDRVLRGSIADGAFVTFWVRERRLVAAMNVNIRGVPDIATRLIADGVILNPSALEDPDVDLAGMTG